MSSPNPHSILLERLLNLVERLYVETADFAEHPEQEQLWYNRGYANGMLRSLRELGYADAIVARIAADTADPAADCAALGWGRAYRHGEEMGSEETRAVLPARRRD
ncbi:MAG TPA: hypothetical protein VIR60_09235 [Gammaproteobacteria bacterium]